MSEEDLVKGIGSMAGDSSPAGGGSPAGAPADDVSQAELVRQFGDEFRRSMQAAIGRKPIGWKHHECSPGRNSSPVASLSYPPAL